jgi:ActR/RegA family two-component response regulator
MGRVLLVCDDSIAIQHLSEGMQQLAIATEVCVDVSTALRSLNRKKFEAVIIDLGLTESDQCWSRSSFLQSHSRDLRHYGCGKRRSSATEFPDGKTSFRRFGGAES